MAVNANDQTYKNVADPCAAYDSMRPSWVKCNAICDGESAVKDLDLVLDSVAFTNLLIPFSTSMTQAQYNFYRAEAELPGVTSQFLKVLLGGMLRKAPKVILSDDAPKDAVDWLTKRIGSDNSSLTSFLKDVLNEELRTSRAWIHVTHPTTSGDDVFPYPILWKALDVVNWRVDERGNLSLVIVRGFLETFTEDSPYHPVMVEVAQVHWLNSEGNYEVLKYEYKTPSQVLMQDGRLVQNTAMQAGRFELIDTVTPLAHDIPLKYIPAWPLNGSIEPVAPFLATFVHKEVALYNKLSRRNHLLYSSAAYTPWVATTMAAEVFEEAVSAGLGSWIRLEQGDTTGILKAPTEALQDMERAIAAAVEDLAKLGIRMLAPENVQSGVALELRDAAQVSQLGLLNTQATSSIEAAIDCMLFWKYNKPIKSSIEMSADFDPTPLGADWLRLITEWYQQGLLPRSVWLAVIRKNDLLQDDYDDKIGQEEITASELITKTPQQGY